MKTRSTLAFVVLALFADGGHSHGPLASIAAQSGQGPPNDISPQHQLTMRPSDPGFAQALAQFFLPSIYQEHKTVEDRFVSAMDFAAQADPLGFQLGRIPLNLSESTDPRSIRAAAILEGVGATSNAPPDEPNTNLLLALAPTGTGGENGVLRQNRIAKMEASNGPVIYASVRPLHHLASTNQPPLLREERDYYCIAYFMFLPFNRAPLDDKLRRKITFDHEGDLETVQEAVEVGKDGKCRVLEVIMGNHGGQILATQKALEFDDSEPQGIHPRIWFDEGSHEPYPFRGEHGVLGGREGIWYIRQSNELERISQILAEKVPKYVSLEQPEDLKLVLELFLPHNAEPNEQNKIRPMEIRLLPSSTLNKPFDLKAFFEMTIPQQDAEFFMRFPGLYGKVDSPAGPPWNMWDLFESGASQKAGGFIPVPPDEPIPVSVPISHFGQSVKSNIESIDSLTALDKGVKAENKDAFAEGLLFLGLAPEYWTNGANVIPVLSVYFAAKVDADVAVLGPALVNGYVVGHVEIQLSLDNGMVKDKVNIDTPDVRTEALGVLDAFNAEDKMREGIHSGLRGSDASNMIQAMVDKEITNVVDDLPLPIACVTISQDKVRFGLGKRGSGFAKAEGIPYGPIPFSGVTGEFVPEGAQKSDAALVVSIFTDHLWFYGATIRKLGIGIAGKPYTINSGEHKGLNKLRFEDDDHAGRHRLVMYLPTGYYMPDLNDHRIWLANENWNDRIRVVAIRPGPRYAGQQLTVYEGANKDPKFGCLSLGIGDFPLHLNAYNFADCISSFEVTSGNEPQRRERPKPRPPKRAPASPAKPPEPPAPTPEPLQLKPARKPEPLQLKPAPKPKPIEPKPAPKPKNEP